MSKLIASILLLSMSSPALAGGGSFTAQVINFILFLILLFVVARKPIMNALRQRSEGIKTDLDTSQAKLSEAQAAYDEISQKMDNLEAQITAMKSQADKEIEQMKADILARGEADSKRVLQSATQSINEELERAKNALRKETVNAAVELATQQLKQQITDQDQLRLSDEFVSAVDRGVQHG